MFFFFLSNSNNFFSHDYSFQISFLLKFFTSYHIEWRFRPQSYTTLCKKEYEARFKEARDIRDTRKESKYKMKVLGFLIFFNKGYNGDIIIYRVVVRKKKLREVASLIQTCFLFCFMHIHVS